MQWPEVTELDDITISPLVYGSTKGDMTVHAEPASQLLNHYRYGSPESVLKVVPFPASGVEAAEVIDEPVIYGGLMFRHFGHALTEGIHRLWPRYARQELHGAKIAFNVLNNVKIMPYVSEALNLHGISRKDVIPILQPTLFKRLFVGSQARQMAGPTFIPDYQTMLDKDHARRLPVPVRKRRLYISRLHHHHTGSFYGESFIEAELAAAGFEIVYPEKLTLTQLVILLRDSAMAVFAEGSAIHALELCASSTPAVFVIARRPSAYFRFAPLLGNICDKWHVAEHLVTSAGMSRDQKKHSSKLDLAAVMSELWSFVGRGHVPFDQAKARDAVNRDVAAHIADPRNERTDDYSERADELKATIGTPSKSCADQ